MIVLLGIVHIVYGELVQVPGLMEYLDDPTILGSMRVMIYQGGVILLAAGAVQILKGLKKIRLRGAAAFFPLGIIVLNILTFLAIALVFEPSLIRTALPQLVIFILIIILMAIELRSGKTVR
jgi:hypothetical protein